MPDSPTVFTAEELRETVCSSYAAYCAFVQEEGWFDPVHEVEVCNVIQQELEDSGVLEAIRTGNDNSAIRDVCLALVMPRGSLKSTIVTKHLPGWLSTINPNLRSLIYCNTMPNARKKIKDITGVFEGHENYRLLFPDRLPNTGCKWSEESAELPRSKKFPEATFEGAGTKTKVVSRHYNIIVEDDTTAPEKDDIFADYAMPSPEDIERGIGAHKLSTFLLVPKGPRIRIVVSTRWSDQDLIQYIKDNEPMFKVIDIPAERKDPQTGEMKPVFSMFYNRDQLEAIKTSVGNYLYQALFMNAPIPAGSRLFSSEHIIHIPRAEFPTKGQFVITCDPAISQKDTACESSIIGALHSLDKIYVDENIHGRFPPDELIYRLVRMVQKNLNWLKCVRIETVQFQEVLRYMLRDELQKRGIRVAILPTNAKEGKHTRIPGLQPLFNNGQIIFNNELDSQLETEMVQYPHGRLVDSLDCLSMQLEDYRGFSAVERHLPGREDSDVWKFMEKLRAKHRQQNRAGYSDLAPSFQTRYMGTEQYIYEDVRRSLS